MSKIALVHDYFIQMGGAERVAEELHSLFPAAPMFSTVDQRKKLNGLAKKTSWMQNLPVSEKNHRYYFMLYPLAVESLDLSDFDLILSSSSGYAKGVRKKKGATHICYCHTPMRWVWRYESYAERECFSALKRKVLPFLLDGLKKWDLRAAAQPDFYIANSNVVAERIRECYKRESIVIPPPIDVERFSADAPDEDFYLLLSRLVPYKRLDLAVEACRKLNRTLIVIGDGSARAELESLAGEKTRFLGRQPDSVVNYFASRCRALIFPGEEDFGMTPLEVNASGRPVIAFRAGGATETVVEGETGVFFNHQTVNALAQAIEDFENRDWDRKKIRQHAEKFDRKVFDRRIIDFIKDVMPVALLDTVLENKLETTFKIQQQIA